MSPFAWSQKLGICILPHPKCNNLSIFTQKSVWFLFFTQSMIILYVDLYLIPSPQENLPIFINRFLFSWSHDRGGYSFYPTPPQYETTFTSSERIRITSVKIRGFVLYPTPTPPPPCAATFQFFTLNNLTSRCFDKFVEYQLSMIEQYSQIYCGQKNIMQTMI